MENRGISISIAAGIKADAFTNLLVGILVGSVLFTLQTGFSKSMLVLTGTIVYTVYLFVGYMYLFSYYHRDRGLFEADSRRISRMRFRVMALLALLICCLLSICPKFLTTQKMSTFYATMLFVTILDLGWQILFNDLVTTENRKDRVTPSILFDIISILLFSLLFSVVREFDDLERAISVGKQGLCMSVSLFHLFYLIPFIGLFFKLPKDE